MADLYYKKKPLSLASKMGQPSQTLGGPVSTGPVVGRISKMIGQPLVRQPRRPTVGGAPRQSFPAPPSQAIQDYSQQIGRRPTMAELQQQGLAPIHEPTVLHRGFTGALEGMTVPTSFASPSTTPDTTAPPSTPLASQLGSPPASPKVSLPPLKTAQPHGPWSESYYALGDLGNKPITEPGYETGLQALDMADLGPLSKSQQDNINKWQEISRKQPLGSTSLVNDKPQAVPNATQPIPAAPAGGVTDSPSTPLASKIGYQGGKSGYSFGFNSTPSSPLASALERNGVNADLTVQPQQTLDGAAALQGRLTASGAPYTAPTHRSFNVDGKPAPIKNPFGTLAQKMERGAGNGYLPRGSTVTVGPDGRAVVQGNMDARQLSNFGIDLIPTNEGVKRDTSRQSARLAANRKRMENQLLANRLGVENPAPMAPVMPGTGMGDIQAAVTSQNSLADQLGRTPSARLSGAPTPLADSLGGEQSSGPNDQQRWNNDYDRTYQGLIASGIPPAQASQEARNHANTLHPGIGGGTTTGAPNTLSPSESVSGVSDPVAAEAQMHADGYSQDEIDSELERMLSQMTPAERRAAEQKIDFQRRMRTPEGRRDHFRNVQSQWAELGTLP